MARIHVDPTPSGYLPVMSWGQGADMDRQAYSMAYANLDVAERIARQWAEEQGAEYVPFDDAGRQTDPRFSGKLG